MLILLDDSQCNLITRITGWIPYTKKFTWYLNVICSAGCFSQKKQLLSDMHTCTYLITQIFIEYPGHHNKQRIAQKPQHAALKEKTNGCLFLVLKRCKFGKSYFPSVAMLEVIIFSFNYSTCQFSYLHVLQKHCFSKEYN